LETIFVKNVFGVQRKCERMTKCGGTLFNRHKWHNPIKKLGARICKRCGETELLRDAGPDFPPVYMSCSFSDFKDAIENYKPQQEVEPNIEALEWLKNQSSKESANNES